MARHPDALSLIFFVPTLAFKLVVFPEPVLVCWNPVGMLWRLHTMSCFIRYRPFLRFRHACTSRDDKSHSGCNNAEQFHSFTSPHDISWMVVCRHRVFPKSVIGLAQLLLSFRPNKRRFIAVEARHTAKLKAISQARPIIMYSMFSYLFSGFAPCGAWPYRCGPERLGSRSARKILLCRLAIHRRPFDVTLR